MIDLQDVIRQLRANGAAISALLDDIPADQARWQPEPQTWSLEQVMAHLYNEERIDFRKHLREVLSEPQQPWGLRRDDEILPVSSLREALDGFLAERAASLAWLQSLAGVDWSRAYPAPWGEPIRAGDLLASWLAHDYLHLRQLNEVLYALQVDRRQPYSVDYAGEW